MEHAGDPDAPEPGQPPFPLLWDANPIKWYDLDDTANATLNMEGKGVYLPAEWDQPLASSHRLDLPFPLRSAVSSDLYRTRGDAGDGRDGAALPLLAGALSKGR